MCKPGSRDWGVRLRSGRAGSMSSDGGLVSLGIALTVACSPCPGRLACLHPYTALPAACIYRSTALLHAYHRGGLGERPIGKMVQCTSAYMYKDMACTMALK